MKSGINAPFSKFNENKNHSKKGMQNYVIDPFDGTDIKCSYTDVMKAPVKKRVPFIEILNQQEEDRKS